ncbi:acyl--CoA ligase [Virgibacillus sp. NKC19-3]|uniref:class I adenylate-forming enzyme family protein n=1 Tax=Virgibacillus saliphilus TaxID=2831674 RepID=UPI001C9B62D1|nr:class I adenylate-forming enzyme family protein [Virgibacillus sp. NKC19-3]MBY7144566.1 acyl--CoA ligase [Virgibacillus sp. NKC19-3]
MVSGNVLWKEHITKDLVTRKFNNREYDTFNDLKRNMYHVLKENVIEVPNKVGIIDANGRSYTYVELLKMTDKLSSYLTDKYKIERGKHIGLLLFNSIEFIISFLAAQKLGVTIIPFPTKFKEPEICALIEKSNCDLLIVDEKYFPWVRKYENKRCHVIICESQDTSNGYAFHFLNGYPEVETEDSGSIEDVAIIMFTSGTTTFSKGVVIRNFNVQHAIVAYHKILDLNESDSTILATPIYNVTGLIATLSLFLKCKGTVRVHKFFDVNQLLSDISTFNITFYHASPTIFTLMLKEKGLHPNLSSLKTLACGSSNMPAEMIKELKEWLPQMSFRTVYGLSETTSPATIFPSDVSVSEYIGSSGQPIPGLSIKIVDDSGYESKRGKTGEIWVRGTNVIEEYYNQKSDLITGDKWLKTGDIGYINKEGYLYVVDRKKDLINRGGEKIFSIDIENAIYQIDGISEVAVVGVKDYVYGEVPVAVISIKEGHLVDEASIKLVLKNKLASYETPTEYHFVDEILKTANGKIDKKEIRSYLEKQKE